VKPRTCPVCGSERVIIILRDGRKGLCYDCGSQLVETILGEKFVSVPGRSFEAKAHQPGASSDRT
jgi:hypothetical protein